MHTTWRATASHWLLGAAVGVGVLIAIEGGNGTLWWATATWLLLALTSSALYLSLDHHRRGERFRRHLALGLTHHLRTSLAHIQAYNEMLLLGNDSDEEERVRWLEIVGRETERLGAAVENVLLLVSESSAEIDATRKPFDFSALVEDVACAYDCPSGPAIHFGEAPAAGLIVMGNQTRLRHALMNLFEGLRGCCPAGGSLEATLSSSGELARLEVGIEGDISVARLSSAAGGAHPDACAGTVFGLELAAFEHVVRASGGRATPFQEIGRSGYRLDLPLHTS